MAEFAFEVGLAAMFRVDAESREEAEDKLFEYVTCLDAADLRDFLPTVGIEFTELSLTTQPVEMQLLEIDGKEITE